MPYRLEFLLCTLTPEVQCLTFHRNHVVWQMKITNFWRNGNDSKQEYCRIWLFITKLWFFLNFWFDRVFFTSNNSQSRMGLHQTFGPEEIFKKWWTDVQFCRSGASAFDRLMCFICFVSFLNSCFKQTLMETWHTFT